MHNGPTKLTMRNGEPALRKRVLYRRHSCASTPNHSPRAVIRRTERLSVEVVVGLRGRSAQRVTGKRSKNGCGVTRGSAPYFKGKELHLSRILILRHGGTTGTLRGLTNARQLHDTNITQDSYTHDSGKRRNTLHGITCTKFATHSIYA